MLVVLDSVATIVTPDHHGRELYVFNQWSDGSVSNPHRSLTLTGPRTLTANYKKYLVSSAENSTLTIQVLDAKTLQPVAGAMIYLDGKYIGRTDTSGELVLTGVTEGTHKLIVLGLRYKPNAQTINVVTPSTVVMAYLTKSG